MKASRPRPGVSDIRLPGERGLAALREAERNGVPVADAQLARLNALAAAQLARLNALAAAQLARLNALAAAHGVPRLPS